MNELVCCCTCIYELEIVRREGFMEVMEVMEV